MSAVAGTHIHLPPGTPGGGISLADALQSRRSVRSFGNEAVNLGQVSNLLWAAQGITHGDGHRTTPSAGALYPLEAYLVSGNVEELAPGVFRYDPRNHILDPIADGERLAHLGHAAFSQDWLATAAIAIVLGAVSHRTTSKYGERGHRYVHMEVGHVAQNVYLQAHALGLGTTIVGAFEDDRVRAVLDLPDDVEPMCLLPIGAPR
jgi:SagB-type dehydrogenase family enzyme